MAERKVIGEETCASCGQPVELRVNVAGKIYYVCDGTISGVGCNATFKYGAHASRRMIAEHARKERMNGANDNDRIANDNDGAGNHTERRTGTDGGSLFG